MYVRKYIYVYAHIFPHTIDLEIVKINEFCDRIMNRIFIDIKQELLKINFNEYTFYYMVLYLLKFSEKGRKKKITRNDSWKLNLPKILNIEIIKNCSNFERSRKNLCSKINSILRKCFFPKTN